jgi:hypothetical protein
MSPKSAGQIKDFHRGVEFEQPHQQSNLRIRTFVGQVILVGEQIIVNLENSFQVE